MEGRQVVVYSVSRERATLGQEVEARPMGSTVLFNHRGKEDRGENTSALMTPLTTTALEPAYVLGLVSKALAFKLRSGGLVGVGIWQISSDLTIQ